MAIKCVTTQADGLVIVTTERGDTPIPELIGGELTQSEVVELSAMGVSMPTGYTPAANVEQ